MTRIKITVILIAMIVFSLYIIWPKQNHINFLTTTEKNKKPHKEPYEQLLSNESNHNNGEWPIEKAKIKTTRDQRVQEKLLRFLKRTANVSTESVNHEQEKITKNLLAIKNQPTKPPQIQIIEDEQGEKWEQLQYSDGTVRYMPISR